MIRTSTGRLLSTDDLDVSDTILVLPGEKRPIQIFPTLSKQKVPKTTFKSGNCVRLQMANVISRRRSARLAVARRAQRGEGQVPPRSPHGPSPAAQGIPEDSLCQVLTAFVKSE